MSQVRKERVDISPEDFETVVEACQDAGVQAKIITAQESRFGRSYGKTESGQVVQITGHGIETWGQPVVEVVPNRNGEGVEFVVDLHSNRAANDKKFQGLKSQIHAHYQKHKAIKAAKKMGFTVASTQDEEDKITIKVRKFI